MRSSLAILAALPLLAQAQSATESASGSTPTVPACGLACFGQGVAENEACGSVNNACAAAANAGGTCTQSDTQPRNYSCLAVQGCVYIQPACCLNQTFLLGLSACAKTACSDTDFAAAAAAFPAMCPNANPSGSMSSAAPEATGTGTESGAPAAASGTEAAPPPEASSGATKLVLGGLTGAIAIVAAFFL